jgi:excisionase family DNA binding protein
MRKRRRKKPDELPSEVMSLREAATYLNCSYQTLFQMVHQGVLPGFRLNRRGDWRFFRSEIDQWIAARLRMKKISAPAKPAPARADEIMTVATLARYLQCFQTMIYKLLKRKKIPAFRLTSGLGGDWRFSRAAIDEWIATLYVINPPVTRGSGREVRGRKSKVS